MAEITEFSSEQKKTFRAEVSGPQAVTFFLNDSAGVNNMDLSDIFDVLTPDLAGDPFSGADGASPTPAWWEVNASGSNFYGSEGTSPVVIQDNWLRISSGANANDRGWARSRFLVSGDFEITVEVDSSHVMNNSVCYFYCWRVGSSDRLCLGVGTGYQWNRAVRKNDAWAIQEHIPRATNVATLKIKRTGTVVEQSVYQHDWHIFGTYDWWDDDIHLVLHGDLNTANRNVGYRNLTIVSGSVKWPEPPVSLAIQDAATLEQQYVHVVRWDAANKKAELCFNHPGPPANTFHLYYDARVDPVSNHVGPTGSLPAQTVYGPEYAADYSLSQNPAGTAPQLTDATANARHGTSIGSMTADDLVDTAGGRTRGWQFDGADDVVIIPSFSPAALTVLTAFTLESLPAPGKSFRFTAKLADPFRQGDWALQLSNSAGTYTFEMSLRASNNTWYSATAAPFTPVVGQRYVVVGVLGDQVEIYLEDQHVVDPSGEAVTASATDINIGCSERRESGCFVHGVIDHVTILNKAANQAEVVDHIKTLNDDMLTWFGPPVESYLDQITNSYIQSWLDQRTKQAVVLESSLEQITRAAALVESYLDQRTAPAGVVESWLEQITRGYALVESCLDQHHAVCSAEIEAWLDQAHAVLPFDLVESWLDQLHLVVNSDMIEFKPDVVRVTVAGIEIDVTHISLEETRGDYFIKGTFNVLDEVSALICGEFVKEIVRVEVGDQVDYLRVTGAPLLHDTRSGPYWTLDAKSPAWLMSRAGGAAAIEAEYGRAMVSDIIRQLCEPYNIVCRYEACDWYLPAGAIYANNEVPLEVIRKPKEAVEAMLQSDPDGSLTVKKYYSVPVNKWWDVEPEIYLTDQENFFETNESDSPRDGYNVYTVTDMLSSGGPSVQWEPVTVSPVEKHVRLFVVPFPPEPPYFFTTGGSHVIVEPRGMHTMTMGPEIIEIVDGEGRVSRPVYGIVSHSYQEAPLGAVSYGEDGTIKTEVKGESLLKITWITRFWLCRVVDRVAEKIQLVADDIEVS